MKSLAAVLLCLGFWVFGTMTLAQVGPVWARVVGGSAIMFLVLILVQQLADLQKKNSRAEGKKVEVLFEDRSSSKEPTVESQSEWRH